MSFCFLFISFESNVFLFVFISSLGIFVISLFFYFKLLLWVKKKTIQWSAVNVHQSNCSFLIDSIVACPYVRFAFLFVPWNCVMIHISHNINYQWTYITTSLNVSYTVLQMSRSSIHRNIYIHIYIHTHINTYTYIYACVFMFVSLSVCLCAYVWTYVLCDFLCTERLDDSLAALRAFALASLMMMNFLGFGARSVPLQSMQKQK